MHVIAERKELYEKLCSQLREFALKLETDL
jgi:hypothetical protein